MKPILLAGFLSLSAFSAGAQYKFDNVLYKTVDPRDLPGILNDQPGYLLLDVRSKGEFEDSSSTGLNIGHLKGAINLNVRTLQDQLSRIADYKAKPVFVYCSHSQRSRRASKMLADSGFTRVYNINGGMTDLQQYYWSDDNMRQLIETKLDYQLIAPSDICTKMERGGTSLFLLDIRSDSAFNHITADAEINACGYLKNSVHIPLDSLVQRMGEIPSDKEDLVIDQFGNESPRAARLLKMNGYAKVMVMTEGLARLLKTDKSLIPCFREQYVSPVGFGHLTGPELVELEKSEKELLVLDIRSEEEFRNKHKNYWMNIGRLKGAVHIPLVSLLNRVNTIEAFKNKPVVLYSFGTNPSVYEAAGSGEERIYRVFVLQGGIFSIRWTAANVKGIQP
ncbi:MAG: rhodanese-like domain-containing protein [Chitinophagaceae bacterium]|nr:rhodanese-like domain-containing protein [Chitinophagaceae bacterium]